MRIYVGTYGKYNSGSLFGKWLEIEDYSDKEEFYEACRELHKNEHDPEFMFQDHEDIPDGYIGESWVSEKLWEEYVPLTEEEREMVQLYRDNIDSSADVEDIQERYRGEFDSLEDYAYDYVEQTTDLKALGWLQYHIDYESIGRDMQLGGDITAVKTSNYKVAIFDNH